MEKITWLELRDLLNARLEDELSGDVYVDSGGEFYPLALLENCEGGLDMMGDGEWYFFALLD